MSSFGPTHHIVQWLIDRRLLLLALAVLVGVAALQPSGQLDFDRSIESMFALDDPLMPPYRQLQRTFAAGDMVIAAYVDPQLMTTGGMNRLASIGRRLEAVPGVTAVLTLNSPMGPDIVDPNNDVAGRFRQLFEGYTHGADGQTVAVVCMLQPEPRAEVPRAETIGQLRAVVETLHRGTLAGEPVMVVDAFAYLEEDGRRLGRTSMLLLALVIIISFRSLRWVIVPLAVVEWTLIVTRAVLVQSGMRLSMVSSVLTAIVTVVGIATVIHLIVRYREARRGESAHGPAGPAHGMAPREALLSAGTLVAAPICWACATDAVGFGSLTTASVGPVQDFGVMMALGSLLVIVAVALLVPGLALIGRREERASTLAEPGAWNGPEDISDRTNYQALLTRRAVAPEAEDATVGEPLAEPSAATGLLLVRLLGADPQWAWGERHLDRALARSLNWVQRHGRVVATITVSLAVLAVVGSLRLSVETDFTKNFRRRSPIVRSYDFVERRLGGAAVWDVVLPAPPVLNWKYLSGVLDMEAQLRSEVPDLTKVLSLADAIHASDSIGLENVRLARIADTLARTAHEKMKRQMPEFAAALYGEDPERPGHWYLRIMLRAPERQRAEAKQAMIARVREIVDQQYPRLQRQMRGALPPDERPQVTGYFVLLTRLIDSMTGDQWITFGWATLGIGIMMWLALGSLRLGLVALVPSALPVLLVFGVLGWLDLPINMGSAMIAAVSLGLAVDSTIHYITAFRRARHEGALRRAEEFDLDDKLPFDESAATEGQSKENDAALLGKPAVAPDADTSDGTVRAALEAAHQTVGRAAFFSTLALVAGFSTLCTSQFVPIVYFGALVSIAMIGGLVGNLFLLPLLITWVERDAI